MGARPTRETSPTLTAYGCTRPADEWHHVFCVHEAAHAVAVLVLLPTSLVGVEVARVDEIPAEGEPGCVRYTPAQSNRRSTAAKIVVALASEPAQTRGFPHLTVEAPTALQGFVSHDWERAAEAAKSLVDSDLKAFIAPFQAFADRLVEGCWPSISAVASEIRRHPYLTGTRTAEVVSRHLTTEKAKCFHDELTSLLMTSGMCPSDPGAAL